MLAARETGPLFVAVPSERNQLSPLRHLFVHCPDEIC
ncbi:hypothetical protein ACQY74_003811 [Rhizobium leguminosarum bv. trifolii]